MLTKTHFVATADLLARKYPSTPAAQAAWLDVVHGLADLFQESNPRFDRDRFLDYIDTKAATVKA